LQVDSSDTSTLEYPELHERRVDLALARLARPPSEGKLTEDLDAEVLFNDRFCLAVGATSKWAQRRKIKLAELANEPWISPRMDSLGGSSIVEAFRSRGLAPPKLAVTTFSVHLRHYMGASGRFITALPESLMRLNPQFFDLKILPIELPMPSWPVGIVTLKNRTLNPAARLFIECAREVAKLMTGGRATSQAASPHQLTTSPAAPRVRSPRRRAS
jgi:DNA-binding transcriptional LysR family regulator